MRIYNGTGSQLTLPFSGNGEKLTIQPHSVSGNFLPSTEFLSLLVTSFKYEEIALIVSGPFEINMCSGVTGANGFVVQSIDEAVERFAEKPLEEEKKSCDHCCEGDCGCNEGEGCRCCEEEKPKKKTSKKSEE